MSLAGFPAGISGGVRFVRVLDRAEVSYYLAPLFTVPPLFVLPPHLFLPVVLTSHFLLDFSPPAKTSHEKKEAREKKRVLPR